MFRFSQLRWAPSRSVSRGTAATLPRHATDTAASRPRRAERPASTRPRRRIWATASAIAIVAGMGPLAANVARGALAFPPVAPAVAASTQFDVTGFLQTATVDDISAVNSGGVLTVNGQAVVVPKESIVILPASAMTWQELFTKSPAPYTGVSTGMALADVPKPLTTYEVHVVGNRVIDPQNVNGCTAAGGCDRMIAGLIHVSQQDLNSGAGHINAINYATGEMEVGGTPGVAGTGTKVRINDPTLAGSTTSGRFGRAMSPDLRFQVDQDNPTVAAETGFPMCIPRTDPAVTDDAECPQANRPVYNGTDTSGITPQPALPVTGAPYTMFRMDDPALIPSNCARGTCADPRKQAPFEIGDYVTFAGTLIQDGATQYVSAHTLIASLGIYTAPGKNPAYVSVETSLIGTGGLTVFGAGEAAVRTRFEGMSTDETRLIRVYGVDINPATGATSDREWGTVMPDPGPPGGAVRGRWRFRPPCTATVATQKSCTPPPAGTFLPPTREVRAVVDGSSEFLPGSLVPNPNSQVPGTPTAQATANGIFWGQYHAPISEYIFPENVPGAPVPENNFNTIPFLAYGGYTSITGARAGVLSPWPSNVVPAPVVCAVPTINGGPYTVAAGGGIPLSGSVTAGASSPVTLQWSATDSTGASVNGALTGATTTTPTFNSSTLAAGVYNLTFAASNICGTASATSTVTVTTTTAPAPTIDPIQNLTVTANQLVTLTATSKAVLQPTWAWRVVGTPPGPISPVQDPAAATATSKSTLSFLPTIAGTYTIGVTATNANGSSPESLVTVTVTPFVPTNVTLNNEYRTSKQRLIVTATSTDTTVTSMVLQPYLTDTGTVFDPTTLGANLTVSLIAPGSFTLTAVGAPAPACNLDPTKYATPCAQSPLTVKSLNGTTIIGTSAPSPLTKIRQ